MALGFYCCFGCRGDEAKETETPKPGHRSIPAEANHDAGTPEFGRIEPAPTPEPPAASGLTGWWTGGSGRGVVAIPPSPSPLSTFRGGTPRRGECEGTSPESVSTHTPSAAVSLERDVELASNDPSVSDSGAAHPDHACSGGEDRTAADEARIEKELDEALMRLDDRDPLKRILALLALARVAKRGNAQIICMICMMRNDLDARVRCEALAALCSLAFPGDSRVLSAARACLQDEHRSVRSSAVQVLNDISKGGDEQSITALGQCLADRDKRIAQQAVLALCQIAAPNASKAIEAVCLHFEDEWGHARKLAIKAVVLLAVQHRDEALAAANARLQHQDSRIRIAAEEVLRKMEARNRGGSIETPRLVGMAQVEAREQ